MNVPPPHTPERAEWLALAVLEVARAAGVGPREVTSAMLRQHGHVIPGFRPSHAIRGGLREAQERAHVLAGRPRMEERKAPRPPTDQPTAQPIGQAPSVSDRVAAHVERDRMREAAEREREHLREIASLREQIGEMRAISAERPPVSIQRRERTYGLREATMLALASDWHLEEPVEPSKIGGVNAYDLAIAEASARRFFNALVWLHDHHQTHFAIRDLVLWLGGDLITGYIHPELEESNQLAPLPALRFAREVIGAGIRMLLAETPLERIVVPCSHGNHGRTTVKPRISTGAENSYEHHLYHALATDFADEPRVTFVISRGPLLYLDVYDMTIRFTHGDAVKYGGGVGGITIPINKAIAGWDSTRRAHLTCMGHWHQYLSGQRALVNGSLIGHSPFADWIKAQFEPPRQAFTLLDSRRGPCMSTPIWCRDDDARHVLRHAETEAIRERVLGGKEAP